MAWRTRRIIDLARAVVQMDVVISVDTMAAHLAASLRVPVCRLLEPAADWRRIGRYPGSVRFPTDVIEEVSERLRLIFEKQSGPSASSRKT